MGFFSWLFYDKKEKMLVLLHIAPALIVYLGFQTLTGSSIIAGLLIMPPVAVFVYTYKTKVYINVISNKYNPQLKLDYKQSLNQTIGALIINATVVMVLILINFVIWLFAIFSSIGLLSFVALAISVISFLVFTAVDKLGLYVIAANLQNGKLGIRDYLNNFESIYKEHFKFVFKTMSKVVVLSFVLSYFLALFAYSITSTYSLLYVIITGILSLAMSFAIYWVDITAIQLFAPKILNVK